MSALGAGRHWFKSNLPDQSFEAVGYPALHRNDRLSARTAESLSSKNLWGKILQTKKLRGEIAPERLQAAMHASIIGGRTPPPMMFVRSFAQDVVNLTDSGHANRLTALPHARNSSETRGNGARGLAEAIVGFRTRLRIRAGKIQYRRRSE